MKQLHFDFTGLRDNGTQSYGSTVSTVHVAVLLLLLHLHVTENVLPISTEKLYTNAKQVRPRIYYHLKIQLPLNIHKLNILQ